MKLVYTVLVLAALVYAEHRLIEPRLTGARLSALVYKVLVYQEWIRRITQPTNVWCLCQWPDWPLCCEGNSNIITN